MGLDFNAQEARFSFPLKLVVPFSEVKWKNSFGKSNFVALKDLQVSLSLLGLIKLKRSINVIVNAFQGKATINLAQGLFSQDSLEFSAKTEQLSFSEIIPEFKDRFEAKIDASIKSLLPIIKGTIDLSGHSKLDGVLKIRDGIYKGGDKIMGLIILPAANDIKLDLNITGKDSNYKFDNISFSSSLGTVSGDAQAELGEDPRFPKTATLKLTIDLTDQGAGFFSEYLRLSCKTQSEPGHRKWSLTLDKGEQDLFPKVESKPL